MYVQLLLNDHDLDIYVYSRGGKPIFCNDIYCGQTTTTSNACTFIWSVCLGMVKKIDVDGEQV